MPSYWEYADEDDLCQQSGRDLIAARNKRNESTCAKFSWAAWCFFVLFTISVAVCLFHLSYEMTATTIQLEENRNTIRSLQKLMLNCQFPKEHDVRQTKLGTTQASDGISHNVGAKPMHMPVGDTLLNNRHENRTNQEQVDKIRNKRSPHRRRRKKSADVGPCHLEGVGVTNTPGANPEQLPRARAESFLWRQPDKQSSAYCFMATESVEEGIESIRVTVSGFYYVYSQLTHYSDGLTETGHRIVLTRPSVSTEEELLESIAQPVRASMGRGHNNNPYLMEASFTAGIFHFFEGDLITVYPFQGGQKFMMLGRRSFFGALYLGAF